MAVIALRKPTERRRSDSVAVLAPETCLPTLPRYRTRWRAVSAITLALIALSLAYTVYEPVLFQHQPQMFRYPADLWLTVRGAQWITWGAFSYLYSSHSALVTLPGFPILLAPAVALSSALHLSFASPGINTPRPTALLVFLPYCLLWCSLALFALDHLAARFGIRGRLRTALLVLESGGIFSAVTVWGHPEDVVALALFVWGLLALDERRPVAAAWLVGGAIAMQLYVLLLIPLLLGTLGRRVAPGFLARAALLPGVLFASQAIPNFRATIHALIDQANYPLMDHPTPWAAISPNLGHQTIAAGPARLVAFAVASGIGLIATRRRQDLPSLAWLAAVVLATRCIFESVVDPYYVMPAVAMAVVLAATYGYKRALFGALVAVGVTAMTFVHEGEWAYWLEMTALLLALLAASRPEHSSDAVTTRDHLGSERPIPLAPLEMGQQAVG